MCKGNVGNVSSSRIITETKGLLCLAKLIEKAGGELHHNCPMAVIVSAAAAELSVHLRQAAYTTNSPAAKALIDQLQRVIKETVRQIVADSGDRINPCD